MKDALIHKVNYGGNVWSIQREGDRKKLFQNKELVCELIDHFGENKCRLVPTTQALLLHQENKKRFLESQSNTLYLINPENKNSIEQGKLWDSFTPRISSSLGFRIQGDVIVSNFGKGLWYITQIEEKKLNKFFHITHPVVPSTSSLDGQVLHASYSDSTGRTLAGINNCEIMNFRGKLRVATFHKGQPLVIASNKLRYCHYWNGKTIENEGTLVKICLGIKDKLVYIIGKHSFNTGIY